MSRSTAIRAAVLFVLPVFAFWPALSGSWIWDDHVGIVENPIFRDAAGLRHIWFHANGADFFPLKDTVLWLEWKIWGANATVFHLTSLMLHLASACLLWAILRRLLPRDRNGALAAWLGALIFSVHPLTVESVAWISELKNTLSLPLLLASWLEYLNWDESRRRWALIRSLLCFAASLLAKSSGVMFPASLLLYAAWRRRSIRQPDLVATAPFFALSLLLGLVTVHYQHRQLAFPDGPPAGNLFTQFVSAGQAIAFYLGNFLAPTRLLLVYPQWTLVPIRAWQLIPLLAFIALGVWLGTKRRNSWDWPVIFGAGFFLINLAPVLGFVRMSYARFSWVADHLVYLPLIGLIGLTAAAVYAGLRRTVGQARAGTIFAATLAVMALTVLTRAQAARFKSAVDIWTYTLRFNPDAWAAEYNLGSELIDQQQPEAAIAHFEAALRINPRAADVENSLGAALAQLGEAQAAAAHITRALQLYPQIPQGHFNLGSVLMRLGRYPEAIGELQAAAREPGNAVQIWSNLGLAQAHNGQLDDAVASYQKALGFDPAAVQVHDNLGFTELMRGRTDSAMTEFQQALRIEPDDADAHFGLGNAMMMAHRPDLAAEHYQTTLRLRPGFEPARQSLEEAQRALGGR